MPGKKTQTSHEFAVACAVEDQFEDLAKGVREAIAALAGVEPSVIRSSDRFYVELAAYDFWGSLEEITLVSELEEHLGISIEDSVAHKIIHPELRRGYTVAEFVRNIADVVGEHWLTETKRRREKG